MKSRVKNDSESIFVKPVDSLITGTDVTGPPSYTVTSPRPSVDNTASGHADFIRHSVKPTSDFKSPSLIAQADHTVLLKLRQGDEYKLVRVTHRG